MIPAALEDIVIIVMILGMVLEYALPIAKLMCWSWIWLYTAPARKTKREERRLQLRAHLHDLIGDAQENGDPSAAIAFQILQCTVRGIHADLDWSVSNFAVPGISRDKLISFSDAIGRAKTSKLVIASIGALGYLNAVSLTTNGGPSWVQVILANVVGIILLALVWNWRHRLARGILLGCLGAMTAALLAFVVWMLVEHRLYEIPAFRQMLFATLPLVLAAVVSDKSFRLRFFNNRWRPVLVTWALILLASLGAAGVYMGGLKAMLNIWAALAILALSLVALSLLLASAATIVSYVGLSAGAASVRLVVAAIRRNK